MNDERRAMMIMTHAFLKGGARPLGAPGRWAVAQRRRGLTQGEALQDRNVGPDLVSGRFGVRVTGGGSRRAQRSRPTSDGSDGSGVGASLLAMVFGIASKLAPTSEPLL